MLNGVKWLFKYIKHFLGVGILSIVFINIYTLLVGIAPIVSKQLIEALLKKSSVNEIYLALLRFSLIWLFQPFVWYISNSLIINFSENLIEKLRNDCFRGMFSFYSSFCQQDLVGTVTTRIIEDTKEIGYFIQNFLLNVAKNTLLIIVIIVMMIKLSPLITVSALIIFLIISIFTLRKTEYLVVLQTNLQQLIDKMNSFLPSIAKNIVSINVNNAQNYIEMKFQSLSKDIKMRRLQLLKNLSLVGISTATITIFVVVIIYAIGTILIVNGCGTIGLLVALTMYFQNFMVAANELFSSGAEFKRISPLIKRLREFIEIGNKTYEIVSIGNDDQSNIEKHLTEKKCCLQLVDVWFKYNNSQNYILKGAKLCIEAGTIVVIIGESGVGKSTLVKLLLGLHRPEKGSIIVCGKDISQISLSELWKLVSYIPQEIDLIYNLSIKENILLSDFSLSETEMINLCKYLKIDERIKKLPMGYETIFGKEIDFSGGEKQRIIIARELIKQSSKIMIFDEPTTWLDEESEGRFLQMISELKKGKIIIIVTHKKNIVDYADKVYVLENGKLNLIR